MTLDTSHHLGTGRRLHAGCALALVALWAALSLPPAAHSAPADATSAPGPSSAMMALSLAQARALAQASDEQIRQMTEAVKAADAGALSARSGRLPQLDLAGTWNRNLKKPVFFLSPDMATGFGGVSKVEMGGDSSVSGALSLSLNLWTAGRLSAAAGAADANVAVTQWQKALVQDAVLYNLDVAYFNLLLAEAKVAIAESAVQTAAEAMRVTDAALAQGTASRFDSLRAEVELANRRAPLIQAHNTRDLAAMSLRRFCGLAPDLPVTLTDELHSVAAPAELPELLSEMRDRSPELRSLQYQVVARQQSVRLARAARGPVVQLQGQYALQGEWDDDFLPDGDQAVGSASVGLAVSVPIFDGFAAKADIGRSEAEWRSATVELERVTRDRELGVRQARIYVINALASLEGRRESVLLAEEAHRLALVRLENGLATPLERLDAELALTDARTQLADILHVCNTAQATLTLAVGTHSALEGDAQEVSR